MAYMDHIADFNDIGWDINHPLWCPGNLLDCPVTQLCRNMTRAPAAGRFWARAVTVKDHYELELGEAVPREIQGTSRRTAYHFATRKVRPQ
jgi:hypothetical protein